MITSETELYTSKTDFLSIQTNTLTMLCLRPNLLYGLMLPMLKNAITNLGLIGSENTPENAYDIEQRLNYYKNKILNFRKDQAIYLYNGKIVSELLKLPNSINIKERVSLIDGMEILNISAEHTSDQATSMTFSTTPLLVTKPEEALVNNNYITLPVKEVSTSLAQDFLQSDNVVVKILKKGSEPPVTVTLNESSMSFVAQNIVYNADTKVLKINAREDQNGALGFRLSTRNDDILKYTFYYTSSELSTAVGGKNNTSVINRTRFDETSISSLENQDVSLIFDRDIIIVRSQKIVFATSSVEDLYGKMCNVVLQYVSIPTRSQNVNKIFGKDQQKHNKIKSPLSFIQAGDFLSDVEVITSIQGELTLSDRITVGPRSVSLGCYRRWANLCSRLPSLDNNGLDYYKGLDTLALKSAINKLNTTVQIFINLFKTYTVGRLQSYVIKNLNQIINQHRMHKHDLALDDLLNGDIVSYSSRTENDSNSNTYLVNVIRRTIYDLVTK